MQESAVYFGIFITFCLIAFAIVLYRKWLTTGQAILGALTLVAILAILDIVLLELKDGIRTGEPPPYSYQE